MTLVLLPGFTATERDQSLSLGVFSKHRKAREPQTVGKRDRAVVSNNKISASV